jgi:hypothetical protein
MTMKGPYREFFPVGEQKVKVRLPAGSSAKAAHLLVAGSTPAIHRTSTDLIITVPSILDHEVVAIDL